MRALGADPRVVPTRDVYDALQQGDIDGMEATYSIINGFKYYEHMKYISDTNHGMRAHDSISVFLTDGHAQICG